MPCHKHKSVCLCVSGFLFSCTFSWQYDFKYFFLCRNVTLFLGILTSNCKSNSGQAVKHYCEGYMFDQFFFHSSHTGITYGILVNDAFSVNVHCSYRKRGKHTKVIMESGKLVNNFLNVSIFVLSTLRDMYALKRCQSNYI